MMTRRNDRTLTTSAGDTVRNRDRWTITATHEDGSITARSATSDATVTLPATYVSEFVQLAYATTEHGNQGITTDTSITLVTATTTGRGLYVGATRGRDHNQLLVLTDQHTEPEAIDLLQRVLATDRADTPAVTHRRQLTERQPTPPGLRRRAVEPDWLHEWHSDVRERVPMIDELLDIMREERPALEKAVANARVSYDKALALPALDQNDLSRARREANRDDDAARNARYRAGNATWRTRRSLECAASAAAERAAVSASRLDELEANYRPVIDQREAARCELAGATQRLDQHDRRAVDLRNYRVDDIALDRAITTWRTWAAGHTVTRPDLEHAVEQFARYVDTVSEAHALLITVAPDNSALNPPAQHVDRSDIEYGIEL